MSLDRQLSTSYDEAARVLQVTLCRADNPRNQIGSALISELRAVLEPEIKRPRLKGLVLDSANEKVFSTGAAIDGELRELDPEQAERFAFAGREAFEMLSRLPCPTVAAISGFALGGGLEIALCCDFRVVTENARLGLPEIKLGVIPGWGGTQRLQRVIGRSHALRMILSGDPISAETALAWGLVDEVVPKREDLLPGARTLLARFADKSPRALAIAKRAVYEGGELPLSQALDLELDLFGKAWGTPDRAEGVAALVEHRRPVWPD